MLRRSFALFLAFAASASSASAQEAGPKRFQVWRPAVPLRSATLDLATGTVTRGPAAHDKVGATVTDFSNLDIAGFFAIDSGSGLGNAVWFCAGTKGFAGNTSDLMSSVTFAYCSTVLDASSGGPGGTVTLGFYEGYVAGGGVPTTTVAVFPLTGMPGARTPGGLNCYFLTVKPGALVPFADGPIGYSWHFMDLNPLNPNLAGTGPMMSCVQSCSGPGPDGQGMIDQIDRYSPPGTLAGSFSIGTFDVSSMAMAIQEAQDLLGTVTPFVGDGINADGLASGPIVVGGTWAPAVGIGHAHGASGVVNLRVRTGVVNGPNIVSPIGGRLTEPLINGPLLFSATAGHNGIVAAFPAQAVPLSLALVNQPWAAQATVLGGGFGDLSRALQGVVGSI